MRLIFLSLDPHWLRATEMEWPGKDFTFFTHVLSRFSLFED